MEIRKRDGIGVKGEAVKENKMEVSPSQISLNDRAVVLFHAPFCGHCRRFKPLFDDIPNVLKTLNCSVKSFEVNVEKYPNPPGWMTAGPINTVPRVVFLDKGKARVFEGDRVIADIAAQACELDKGTLSGGGKSLPLKLMMWREATVKALGKFSIPKKGTVDYEKVRKVYETMIQETT
jgi:thiol-disulfide isomerase/thioredoxin